MSIIGKNIRKVLKTNGHTAAWLAERIGVSRTHVYRIFKKKNIDVQLLLRISIALRHDFFAQFSKSVEKSLIETKEQ